MADARVNGLIQTSGKETQILDGIGVDWRWEVPFELSLECGWILTDGPW